MSLADSRSPSRMSPGARFTAAPPSCTMPTSNVTRVRRLGFSKIIARVRPDSSGCGRCARSSAFNRRAIPNSASISAVVTRCREDGLLINCTADRVLRLTPPLVVTLAEIDEATAILDRALGASA